MSLHAAVYKNLNRLPEDIRALVTAVDPLTGEIAYINDDLEAKHSREPLFAVDLALGNSSMINWLARFLKERCGDRCPKLLTMVLYDGSHSGDFVPLADVAEIRNELALARLDAPTVEQDMREFAEKFEVLISAAIAEENPIVFM